MKAKGIVLVVSVLGLLLLPMGIEAAMLEEGPFGDSTIVSLKFDVQMDVEDNGQLVFTTIPQSPGIVGKDGFVVTDRTGTRHFLPEDKELIIPPRHECKDLIISRAFWTKKGYVLSGVRPLSENVINRGQGDPILDLRRMNMSEIFTYLHPPTVSSELALDREMIRVESFPSDPPESEIGLKVVYRDHYWGRKGVKYIDGEFLHMVPAPITRSAIEVWSYIRDPGHNRIIFSLPTTDRWIYNEYPNQ